MNTATEGTRTLPSRERREIGTMIEDAFAWMGRNADKKQMILLGGVFGSACFEDAARFLEMLMVQAELAYEVKIFPGIKHTFIVGKDEIAIWTVPPSDNNRRWRGHTPDRISMWNIPSDAQTELSLGVLPVRGVVVRYGMPHYER